MPPQQSVKSTSKQPVKVTKKVVVKRKKSLTEFLIITVAILSVFLVVGAFLSVAVWMHTYKALTAETVVADVYVSKKVIKDGKPTFNVRYVPRDDVSGWWSIFGSKAKSSDKEVSAEMIGDQVFFNADYVRWENWVTMFNVKPLYKTNRITSGFRNVDDYKKYNVSAVDVNNGPDSVATFLQNNPGRLSWIAQSVYISSAGITVQNEDVQYKLISTKDALVLERS